MRHETHNRHWKRRTEALLAALVFLIILIGFTTPPARAQATPSPIGPTLNAKGEGDLITGIWPRAMAFDGANLWVINGFEDTILRISENNGQIIPGSIKKVGKQPTSLVWDDVLKQMWVAGYDDSSLMVFDVNGQPVKDRSFSPATNNSLLDGHPIAMAFAGAGHLLWVVLQTDTSGNDNVTRINPGTGELVGDRIKVGNFPTALATSTDGKTLWVANGDDDTISVIDTTKDQGKVVNTIKDTPPFPISLTFDGTYLWVGSYECNYVKKDKTDECKDSKLSKVDVAANKVLETSVILPGRQVAVFYMNGNLWVANAHQQSVTRVNPFSDAVDGANARQQMVKFDASYAGAVLMTEKYVYMADWLNDRIVRIQAPPARATPTPAPTATITAIPTVTLTPTVVPPCNPDPKFPPRLKPGDTARVVNDAFKIPVQIRSAPNFSKDALTGKTFSPGDSFNVLEGPVGNDKEDKVKPDKACFYRVEGTKDKSMAGWITEGALESDKGNKRYYIELMPTQ